MKNILKKPFKDLFREIMDSINKVQEFGGHEKMEDSIHIREKDGYIYRIYYNIEISKYKLKR